MDKFPGSPMYRTLSLTLALALSAGTAHAAGFEAKTMRAPYSSRAVERGLVLGKGWVEISLANEFKRADGYWDSKGEQVDFSDASWVYTTQSMITRATATHGEAPSLPLTRGRHSVRVSCRP